MHILENYSCFQSFSLNFLYFTKRKKTISFKNIFEDFVCFFSEPGHIPDFENQFNIL